jgi:D-alanine-D-alanine ligase
VLVESFRSGLEVTCGILEDEQGVARALPPTLILPRAADWYDFASRYAAKGSEHRCPAPFASSLNERIQRLAGRAHRALGARDLSRADFVVREDGGDDAVTLLEVNTLPGMTPTSLFPEAAAIAGVSFVDLCDRLVRRAHARPARAAPDVQPMPNSDS